MQGPNGSDREKNSNEVSEGIDYSSNQKRPRLIYAVGVRGYSYFPIVLGWSGVERKKSAFRGKWQRKYIHLTCTERSR